MEHEWNGSMHDRGADLSTFPREAGRGLAARGLGVL